ncbi:hypothetical protein ACJ4V0_21290, partial [Phreatobacter sp. HK31-P]
MGHDLKSTLGRGSRVKIAASCFSIYAFEALKAELSKVESLQFIFTAPTFVPMEVTDRLSVKSLPIATPISRPKQAPIEGADASGRPGVAGQGFAAGAAAFP